MSRGRKERTPAQLAVLAQAREKAKIVIAERAKLNALAKKDEAVSEEVPPEPEPVSPEPEPMPVLEDPASESEDEEPRPKYRYVHGVGYIIRMMTNFGQFWVNSSPRARDFSPPWRSHGVALKTPPARATSRYGV